MPTEQQVLDELNKIKSFLAENPISDLARAFEGELTSISNEFARLPLEVSLLADRVSGFSQQVGETLNLVEQSFSDLQNDDVLPLIRELQDQLESKAVQLQGDIVGAYGDLRTHIISSIDSVGTALGHDVTQIMEEIHEMVDSFLQAKNEINETVEFLNRARKRILALTSPLRDTSAAVGDVLKTATEVFMDVG